MRGVLLVLVLSGCAVSRPSLTSSAVPARGLTPGAAPGASPRPVDFTLKRFPDGTPFQLSSLRGRVVLVEVWATWCEPCKATLPAYQQLQARLGERGLQVLTVNVDEDGREVQRFVEESRLTLPVVVDPNARLTEQELQVRGLPTTVLIDRRGVVRASLEGLSDDVEKVLLAQLEPLLAESP